MDPEPMKLHDDQLNEIQNDLRTIKELLAGDDFGNPGLVQQHHQLKGEFYKSKSDLQRIKWLGAIGTSMLMFVVAFKDEIKSLFSK